MPIDIKDNLVGGLNLDDSYYQLPQNSYVDGLNITKDAVEQSQDLAITNIVGNQLIPYNKPTGRNKTIGARADIVRGRVYEFMWNSNDKHSIVIYDNETRTRYKLLENLTDTNDVDVLQFDENYKIVHIDIIYRSEDEGDLLSWTDANVTPRELNVKDILDGRYTAVKVNYIEAAKRPPLDPPTCVYGNDSTRNANSLRKKMFMFCQGWGYDSFYSSTVSTYSKIPLPIGYYDSDNDIDNTKNNYITVTLQTGDENVRLLFLYMRSNDPEDTGAINHWGNFVQVVALNKEELNIPSNSTYDFLFYNDQLYPIVDQDIIIAPLADFVPKKANAQCLPNGNVKVYGGITEGFPNYPVDELDVTITAENVTNVPTDSEPPSMSYEQTVQTYVFTIAGGSPVVTGTLFKVIALANVPPPTIITLAEYTSLAGDTLNDVAQEMYNYILANHASYAQAVGGQTFTANLPSGSSIIQVLVTPGTPSAGTISTEKTWLPDANYIFGQVYENEQGLPMPGVTTFVNPVDSDNDYLVTTPSFSEDGGQWQTPVITAEVNHLPMEDAVKVNWVRRRMTYADFLFYELCDYQSDSDYLYFCLANIEQYKEDNSQFVYSTAPINKNSRIKIVAGITTSGYNGDVFNQDYEILGTVSKTLTSGSSPDDDKLFIKVKKPSGSISPAYTQGMLVFVYTPMSNPTEISDSVYNEWGETYDIYEGWTITVPSITGTFEVGETIAGGTSGATGIFVGKSGTTLIAISDLDGTFVAGETLTGGTSGATAQFTSISDAVNYHRGMTQDQTSFQPAIYVWEEGDVYFHSRTMYNELVTTPYISDTVPIMDANYSDFFPSAVNDNGRGQLVVVNAAETYFPATCRFSLAFQQNTNINQLNRFLYNNFEDYDRSFGDIYKLSIFNRYMDVGQRFKIGSVPIFNQISKDSQGNFLLAATDKLLNPINYYVGDFGVSVLAPVWVQFNNSRYFFDVNRGIWCRLSLDGITPISVLYKINSWATTHGVLRTGNYKIYGTYDSKSNNCIFAFEATAEDSAYTLSFDEEGNSFESFLSYHPEMMCTLGALLITWKNGDLYTHDSETYNKFYSVQYPSSATLVFNDKVGIKKVYNALAYQSNETWESPTKGDVETSTVNPQTLMKQQSKISTKDYDIENNPNRYAALNRDMNSMSDERLALWEGDYVVGNWIRINFVCPATKANKLIHFNKPYLNWQIDQRNY